MRTVIITPATWKPLLVEEVKLRPELRVEGSTDDLLIADLIEEAVALYEEYTEGVMRRSTCDVYHDAFGSVLYTPAPLYAVTSVSYLDTAGVLQAVDTTIYTVDTTSPLYGRVTLQSGQTWPTALTEANAVVIRAEIGWETPADIPRLVRNGMYLHVQQLMDGIDQSDAVYACWRKFRRIPI